jgi:hypothetical protein
MADQTPLGRMKHAVALMGLAITEYERGDRSESAKHLDMSIEEAVVANMQLSEEVAL